MARPRGRDPAKTPTIVVGFAVDEETRDQLHTVANSSGMNLSTWLREVVADAIEKQTGEPQEGRTTEQEVRPDEGQSDQE